jgi:DNA-cytosine methyltransferase
MKVLSCFDGMSCGQIAFERAGIPIEKYYASEIDKYAIQVTQANYPETVQLGSITEWRSWNIEHPDIIIGGSPCQGFSFAGKGLNFEDDRSKLFFVFVDILKYYKPKYFLLENVVMKKEHNDVISSILGDIYPECVTQSELFRTGRLEPIQINSALVSAQNRNRLYWTNIPGIEQPEDEGILLKDIIENATADKDKSYCLDANYYKGASKEQSDLKGRRQLVCTGGAFRGRNPENTSDRTPGAPTEQRLEINETGKSNALTSVSKDSLVISNYNCDNPVNIETEKMNCLRAQAGGITKGIGITTDNITWRKLTPIECERLQTVPDDYTNHVSNSQRYRMLGNGWTVDVIVHIFKNIEY